MGLEERLSLSLYKFRSIIRSWIGPTCSCHMYWFIMINATAIFCKPGKGDSPLFSAYTVHIYIAFVENTYTDTWSVTPLSDYIDMCLYLFIPCCVLLTSLLHVVRLSICSYYCTYKYYFHPSNLIITISFHCPCCQFINLFVLSKSGNNHPFVFTLFVFH